MLSLKKILKLLTGFFVIIVTLVISDIYTELEIWERIKSFFSLKANIPVWIIVLSVIVVFVLMVNTLRNPNNKKTSLPKFNRKKRVKKTSNITNNSDVKIVFGSPESYGIKKADQKFNVTLNSKFLNSENGIFSIWAYVSDVHNSNPKQHKYIVGYATNGGRELKNTELAKYPNAWAICRVTPIDSYPKGLWRFWCNNVSKEQIRIETEKILNGGWHLFSVAWSRKSNYIKFIIDKDILGEEEFKYWPSDFSEPMRIGTWPTKSPGHYFESLIGPWRFVQSEFDMRFIGDYWNKKPD